MNTTAHICHTRRDGCAIVTVVGRLDPSNLGDLVAALARTITRDRPTVLDLSGVAFMHDTGTHVLTAANHTAIRQHARLTIVPSPAVTRLLDRIPRRAALTVHADLASALTAAQP